jgi:hypothetical protein
MLSDIRRRSSVELRRNMVLAAGRGDRRACGGASKAPSLVARARDMSASIVTRGRLCAGLPPLI